MLISGICRALDENSIPYKVIKNEYGDDEIEVKTLKSIFRLMEQDGYGKLYSSKVGFTVIGNLIWDINREKV